MEHIYHTIILSGLISFIEEYAYKLDKFGQAYL